MGHSRWWLCALVVAIASLAGGGAAPLADAQPSGGSPEALSGGLVVQGAGLFMDGQSAAAQASQRANPEAVVARAVSATAHEGLGAHAAETLAGESFPGLISDPNGGRPQLPAGERLTGFADQFVAHVDLGAGEHGLLESNVPMAIKGSSGTWSPINLALHETSAGFVGANPLVDASLPKDLTEGARLTGIGLSVTPVDAHGEPLNGAAGTVDGASDFIANSLQDADTVLKLSTYGFSIDTLLRSENSPEHLAFRVGLPSGAHLVSSSDEPGAVQVVKDGATIATMPAPSAQDATGTNVPVSVRVSGDVVELTVARQAGEYLYPIAVDPEYNTTSESTKLEASTWPTTNGGGLGEIYGKYGSGEMWVEGTVANNGEWVAFNYVTKGTSKIYEVESTATVGPVVTEGSEYWVTGSETYIEFHGPSGFESKTIIAGSKEHRIGSPTITTKACDVGCSAVNGSAKNAVSLVLRATQSFGSPKLLVKSAKVWLSQPTTTHSTVSYNTSSSELEYSSGGKMVKATNVLSGAGSWLGPNSGAFEFKSEDLGLGVSGTRVSVKEGATWTEATSHNYLGSSGCLGVQCSATEKEVVPYASLAGHLPDGYDTVRVDAHDAMSATWSSEHGEGETTVKVDATAPHGVVLTGLTSKGGVYELDETVSHVTVEVSDGEGSTPSSGMRSIALAVDGTEIGTASGACSPGPCTAKGEWSLNGGEFGAGKHALTVVATDNAGNVSSSTTALYVFHAGAAPVGPGSVNTESGNYQLQSTDVSVSGGMGDLTVARTYQSRNPSAGAGGPLGPQWSMGLGSETSLEVEPTGSVQLNGKDGGTFFEKQTGGGFVSPGGDSNLTMEAVEHEGKVVEYLLKNKASGTTTRFTLPSGAAMWMPTVSESAIATRTTTDEYTTVEPEAGKKIVEPTLEVAPHPLATCSFKKLEKGCRALEFNYASSTTATGESEGQWGDYKGNLTRVYFIAWDPVKKEMVTSTVAQYTYDAKGRLRAEWDPRMSPALKTIYGYDSAGHVTALTPPGQETWAFTYGPIAGDVTSGRLLRVIRAPAAAPLWSGSAPSNSAVPVVAPEPSLGVTSTVSTGTWSGSPVGYRYQWQRCNAAGESCMAITGADNETYKPAIVDAGYKLRVEVQATNGGGSTVAFSAVSKVVATSLSYQSKFGSWGEGNGQFKWAQGVTVDASGSVWVADTFNNRVQEFSSSGTYIRQFGTAGTGTGQFKEPFGIAINSEGNLWVTDAGNNRVQEFSSTGTYMNQFGTAGSGAGQFSWPNGITITPEGNIWVADTHNNRVEEFSSAGAYVRTAASTGGGHELSGPKGVASDGYNDVWVTDSGHSRVEEFGAEGAFVLAFGAEGSGHGQFKESRGIAVDSSGEVWVTDRYSGRVQGFTASGEFLTQYGGASEFNEPEGIAVTGSGKMYVADTSNYAIQAFQTVGATALLSSPSSFSAYGTGVEPTAWQQDIALDAAGNVWVADALNNCVWEFSSSGTYLLKIGSVGTGTGQLKGPGGLAITSEGNIWVVDGENNRLEEFSSSGSYIRQFGSGGSAAGQFSYAHGVALIPANGNIAVADAGNNRIQIFNSTGTFIREIKGSGSNSLTTPLDVTVDAEGHLWVADSGNNRIVEFSESGTYIRMFGSFGGARGQFNNPNGLAIDGSGDIWVTDSYSDRIEGFGPNGEFIGEYGGWPQFYDPGAIAINNNTGNYYVLNSGYGKVEKITLAASTAEAAPTPRTEGAALSTIEYNVPVSGSGAPYAMSSSQVAKWAQTDVPVRATAVFPADSPQGWPAPEYKRATVYYLDAMARDTNVALPGGGISTTEYNAQNDKVRALSVANRAKALEGAKSAEVSKLLDSQEVYTEEGRRLSETLGPQHTVKIAVGNEKVASGSEVLARDHTKYYYDEGAPGGEESHNLVTKVTDGAETASKEEFDVRTNTVSYSGQSNLGWRLRQPTSKTTDPSGLKITTTTVYDEATGVVVETRGAASAGAGDPRDRISIYYSAEANATYPACGNHIEWAGLPCEVVPGKQPETGPPLPVVTTTYDMWDQAELVTETFGATTRTTKTTFDAINRAVTTEVTSSAGKPVPAVTNHYDEKSGALTKRSETVEGVEKVVTAQYNTLGELESYTDADGGKAAYKYDVDGRTTETANYAPGGEERGKQTYSYESTTGYPHQVVDSAAGAFTASYNVAGGLTSETFPNKMTASMTYNSVGETTGIEYNKTAFCNSTCPEKWSSDTIVPSIHGQPLKESGTLSEEPKFVYDAVGRLTEVGESPTGLGCTTRIYGYDGESNRTSVTTREPGSEGKCATEGGTVESHTFDTGNRIADSGVSYDALGNIAKLPAADAGGAEVISSYYSDSQVYSQEQGGKTTTYYMDPEGRTRESRTPGVAVTHYAGPGASVAWMLEPEGKWTRNIVGIDSTVTATQTSAGVVTLLVHDLHGDVVGTAALDEKQTKLLTTYRSTEYGVPTTGSPPKYSWMGASGVTTESSQGLVVQGGSTYVPQIGQSLQTAGIAVPNPDNAATPYMVTLAPWVAESTAAIARQLTDAEEAARKAAEAEAGGESMEEEEEEEFNGDGGSENLAEAIRALGGASASHTWYTTAEWEVQHGQRFRKRKLTAKVCAKWPFCPSFIETLTRSEAKVTGLISHKKCRLLFYGTYMRCPRAVTLAKENERPFITESEKAIFHAFMEVENSFKTDLSTTEMEWGDVWEAVKLIGPFVAETG